MTRLHLRYDGARFPDDLQLRETADRKNFQGRYVLRHPGLGAPGCAAARDYLRGLPERFEQRGADPGAADPLADRRDPGENGGGRPVVQAGRRAHRRKWWQRLWPDCRAYGGR